MSRNSFILMKQEKNFYEWNFVTRYLNFRYENIYKNEKFKKICSEENFCMFRMLSLYFF